MLARVRAEPEEVSLHLQEAVLEQLGDFDMRFTYHYDGLPELPFSSPADLAKLVCPGWSEAERTTCLKQASQLTWCCSDPNFTPVIQPARCMSMIEQFVSGGDFGMSR